MELALDAGADDVRLDGRQLSKSPATPRPSHSRAGRPREGGRRSSNDAEIAQHPEEHRRGRRRRRRPRSAQAVDALDDHDDVQNVSSNFNIPEAMMTE